jgi:L-rhamnose-H+ transport protein
MSDLFLPLFLVIVASLLLGSFGLGMKYMHPLPWEAWWLVHAVVGMFLFPLTWALLTVPDLFTVISSAPPVAIRMGMLFGFLWGVGGMLFGVSVRYVGVSITYGFVMGLAGATGSLIPLAQIENVGSNPALPYVIGGVLVMLVGVAICGAAGVKRERMAAGVATTTDAPAARSLKVGLIIAVTSGVLSSLINVGFSNATPVADEAVRAGALTRNSSLAAWVVVLLGAVLMNAGFAVFKLFKNRTWGSFATPGSGKAYRWAVASALLWFGSLGIYGQGAALMGPLGPVVGWPILLGLALIASNAIGFFTGEWKNAGGPFRMMIGGVAVLIVACAIIGYANRVSAEAGAPGVLPSPSSADVRIPAAGGWM